MIDPVNTGYHAYTRIDTQAGNNRQTAEKFSLDYSQEGNDKTSQTLKAEEDGVVVELSGRTKESNDEARTEQSVNATHAKEAGLGDMLHSAQTFFNRLTERMKGIVQNVKEGLIHFWNSDTTDLKIPNIEQTIAGRVSPNTKQTTADRMSRIATPLQNRSDLLTYYDKSGKMVKLSGSDKDRILRGDRNQLKG